MSARYNQPAGVGATYDYWMLLHHSLRLLVPAMDKFRYVLRESVTAASCFCNACASGSQPRGGIGIERGQRASIKTNPEATLLGARANT